jgi:hypothetical protein
MAKQSDLLWRAAVCGRLMNLSIEPKQKQRFKQLRDAWIALAHDGPGLFSDVVAGDIAAVEDVQSVFVDGKDRCVH